MSKNRGYKKTSPNASAKAIRAQEQTELFDTYEFSPRLPNPSSKAGEALQILLTGEALTQPRFLKVTKSWRLSASIHLLKTEYGWPIESHNIPAPSVENPNRYISKYKIKVWALKSLKEFRHG